MVEDMEVQEFEWHSDAWWEKHKKWIKINLVKYSHHIIVVTLYLALLKSKENNYSTYTSIKLRIIFWGPYSVLKYYEQIF